jgi:hypothetical protein
MVDFVIAQSSLGCCLTRLNQRILVDIAIFLGEMSGLSRRDVLKKRVMRLVYTDDQPILRYFLTIELRVNRKADSFYNE